MKQEAEKKLLTRLKLIFKSKNGVSMIIVLAVMTMLIIVGSSVLVAAGGGATALKNRQSQDRLLLYTESLQKTIAYSLKAIKTDNSKDIFSSLAPPESLGGQLVGKIYSEVIRLSSLEEADAELFFYRFQKPLPNPIELSVDFDSGLKESGAAYTTDISVAVSPLVIVQKNYTQSIPNFDGEGNILDPSVEEFPREVTIEADVVITIVSELDGKTVTSVATYSYTNGRLVSGKDVAGNLDNNKMLIDIPGEWRLVSHERIDR